jgi:hypothetical protein
MSTYEQKMLAGPAAAGAGDERGAPRATPPLPIARLADDPCWLACRQQAAAHAASTDHPQLPPPQPPQYQLLLLAPVHPRRCVGSRPVA